MPQEEVGRVQREDRLDELLRGMKLVRTGKPGFPQDGQHYLGRDGLSVWLQKGPRPFTSSADLFEFLEPSSTTK
jgi:hypothetical protein